MKKSITDRLDRLESARSAVKHKPVVHYAGDRTRALAELKAQGVKTIGLLIPQVKQWGK